MFAADITFNLVHSLFIVRAYGTHHQAGQILNLFYIVHLIQPNLQVLRS